jgi:hypothetical protein
VCAAARGCSRKRIVIISIIHFSGALGSLAVASSFGAAALVGALAHELDQTLDTLCGTRAR